MLRVVLVEPEYEINIGSVARAMQNFGCSELYIVKPKANIGFQARMFAKKGRRILEKARVVGSLEAALKGCATVAGTTGVVNRFRKDLKHCTSVKAFAEAVKRRGKGGRIALVFGSEGTGLKQEDFNHCDFIVHIPASGKAPVINLSHAVAIALYEMHNAGGNKRFYGLAGRRRERQLNRMFSEIIDSLHGIRKKRKVKLAFKRIVGRAAASDEEVGNLFAAVSRIRNMAVRGGGK